jgi:hypothetical protein
MVTCGPREVCCAGLGCVDSNLCSSTQ